MVAVVLAIASVSSMAGVAVATPPAGSISGVVHQADGVTLLGNSAHVTAYDYNTGTQLGTTYSSEDDGTYTITGLSSGNYRVLARSNGYYSEYYNNVVGAGAATAVAVTDPNNTANVNFTLAQCGSISGAVHADDGTPVYGAHVVLYNSTTHAMVDEMWMKTGHYDYTVGKDLPAGSYHVWVDALGYFSEYYDNVTTIGAAAAVAVTVPNNTPNINFNLTPGGTISGTVTSDTGAPVYGAHVEIISAAQHWVIVDDVYMSATSNTYSIGTDLPSGSYHVRASVAGYYTEYFNNAASAGTAAIVVVTAGSENTGVDFSLAPCGSISGTITSDTGAPVYGAHVTAYDNVTHVEVDEVFLGATTNTYKLGHNMGTGGYHVLVEATGYFSEYYNNAAAIGSAATVGVTSPNETSGINFSLNDEALHISAVSATPTSGTTATITWTTDQPASSRVDYGLTGSYGTTVQDATLVTSHSVNLTGLTSETTYHYMVSSTDAYDSDSSADGTFITSDVTAPVISAVTATNITATGATITWTTNEPANSQVNYGTTTGYGSSTTLDATLVTIHSVNVTGLTSQTVYHYQVNSADAVGNPAASVDYTFTTPDVTAPVISAVTATNIAATGATITWTTDETADSQVEWGLTTSYGSSTTLDTATVTSHSVSLTGLASYKTYHYRVKSSDAAGNSVPSADFTFITTDVTAPSSPVVTDDGESTTDLTQLHASWTSSDADSGVTEYQYAIGTTSGGTEVVNWTSVGTNTLVTKTGLSLGAGTTYYFTVKAKNGAGVWSNVGTSDGIVAQGSEEPDGTSDGGGGMPVWAWVLIGLGAVAVIGGVGYFAFTKLGKQK
jgi:hypothetical protein